MTLRLACLLPWALGCFSGAPSLIISLIIDDLGRADLGFTGSRISTPNLDRFREEGVALSSHYAQPICTPTRAAFLTGRYPLLLGLQGKETVQQGCSWGLDVDEQTFASAFQRAGWDTHMVGKVHLGADYWRRTPTFRGFNSFVGYYYGAEDYYTHKLAQGYDLRNDSRPSCGPGCSRAIALDFNGTYSSELFGAEVSRLIAKSSGRPTYIHFTPQSVHAPNEAPAAAIAPYKPIFGPNNTIRAIHAGALVALDDSIGVVFDAIKAAGLESSTLLFVQADNGGPMGPTGDGTMASNFPHRGGKHSLLEGGVNVVAFAWGPAWLGVGVNRTWSGLSHVTDVGLTLLEAGGVAPLAPLPGRPVSGHSFWRAITIGANESLREEVIINIDYTSPSQAAIVVPQNGTRRWKLVLGALGYTADESDAFTLWSDWNGKFEAPQPGPPSPAFPLTPQPVHAIWPLPDMTPTLFDLASDPRETTNLSSTFPDIVDALTARLAVWGRQAVDVVENGTADPRSAPSNFNGSWTPWLGL